MFAALETRINNAVNAKLSNATALIAGLEVQGTFSNEYVVELGAEGSSPVFKCLEYDIPTLVRNQSISITYQSVTTSYTVGAINRDGAGMAMLILESV